MKSSGLGIASARAAISGGDYHEPQFVFTGPSGEHIFDDVPTGHWYVVTVRANPFMFRTPSQVVTVNDQVSGVDFVADTVRPEIMPRRKTTWP